MKLSTKGRYAITAMMELAVREQNGPTPLIEIAQTQHISLSYLEQLFAKLRQQGLVKGVRGPGGGFRLNRQAQDITIAEIINAVDGEGFQSFATAADHMPDGQPFVSKRLWSVLSQQIFQFLSGISLAQLMEGPESQALLDRVEGNVAAISSVKQRIA